MLVKIDNGDWNELNRKEWDKLALQFGSPFHSAAILDALYASWPGLKLARYVGLFKGNQLQAAAPFFSFYNCPRLNYYRTALDFSFDLPLLVSHALVGWHGFPITSNESSLKSLLTQLDHISKNINHTILFTGIPEERRDLLETLKQQGYECCWFHTTMTQELTPLHLDDSLIYLPGLRRRRIKNKLSKTRRQGLKIFTSTQIDDLDATLSLFAKQMADLRVDPDVLSSSFLSSLFSTNNASIEYHLAYTTNTELVGCGVCLRWKDIYYFWLAAYDPDVISYLPVSHAMYIYVLQRASSQGLKVVDAGRSPYDIKRRHGFSPKKLWVAAKSPNAESQHQVREWLNGLKIRHELIYPELMVGS